MTIAEWIFETMTKLGEAGVDAPRRDALVLLEDALGKDRAWVLAHPEHNLDVKGLSFHKLEENVERRTNREPLAYIREKAWFYGRFFEVSQSVMIPRPESEAFITLLKELVRERTSHIIDVGTGSGCLAITAKLETPDSRVTAIDISSEALEIAKRNAKKHKVEITFFKSDLLEAQNSKFKIQSSNIHYPASILVANLPYLPEDMITSPEITQEPALALFSGKDGLDHYTEFWKQLGALKLKPKYILTESLEQQHDQLEKLANKAGYTKQKTEQLTQLFVLKNSTSNTKTSLLKHL